MTIVQERPAGFEAARRAMIDSQLRPVGVNAPYVLARMAEVPRERFVPESVQSFAYIDRAVPIGDGRYLASPEFHGTLIQQAAPTMADRALIVDGGSGYLAEVVKPLVGPCEVSDAALAAAGRGGDFTLLLIDGAIGQLPAALAKRLADGARVVTGLAERGVTRLAIGRKAGGNVALLPLAEMGIPELPEFAVVKGWSF